MTEPLRYDLANIPVRPIRKLRSRKLRIAGSTIITTTTITITTIAIISVYCLVLSFIAYLF